MIFSPVRLKENPVDLLEVDGACLVGSVDSAAA